MSNNFFSPFNCNICLLFGTYGEPTNKHFQQVLTCSGCQLIKYCNRQHQKLDWLLHQEFCQAVQKIKEKFKLTHPFYISGVPKNGLDIEKAVIQFKYLLKGILGRRLKHEEEELSSFPVFCGQCFKMKGLKYGCTKCSGQAYCSEQHKEVHREKHEQVCRLLELYYCPYKVLPSETEFCVQFGNRVNDLYKKDLYECIENIFALKLPSNPCDNFESYQMFSWAADFSCIMTVCYAMELLQYQKFKTSKFNLFILGASIEAELWFREVHCKLFFLQNPQVEELELDFIGPEIVELNYKELGFTFLGCKRLVKFNTYRGLFQNYCKSFKKRPCLIVAFNCGFSEFSQSCNITPNMTNPGALEPGLGKHVNANDTWFGGLVEILKTFNTPIVFTSFTKQESAFDFAALQNVANKKQLKIHIEHIFKAMKNSFHDIRPLRQWYSIEQEQFYFRNGYIQAIRTSLEK